MNKKLVAVAIAGVLAAPLAQAQTANVTLYGSFRMAYDYTRFDGPTGDTSVNTITSVSSRWGLRGSEALGKGMNAIFQCETPVSPDDGTAGAAGMCGREGWVGLNGSWGEVKLGYGLTPYDDVKGLSDLQGSNNWENPNNGVSSGPGFAKQGLFTNYTNQGSSNSGAFDARYSNSISYKTPDWKGFSLRTQYAIIDESFAKDAWGWDTAVIYRNGPFVGGLTYAYHSDFAGLGGTILAKNDQQSWRIAGSWNFGPVKVLGYYDWAQYDFGGNLPAGYGDTYDYSNWSLGVQAPWQAWVFNAQYNWRNDGLATAFNASTNTSGGYNPSFTNLKYWGDGGGDHWTVSADYNFSKRTILRMYYAWMQNDGTLNPEGTGLFGKSTIWSLSAGLWHHF
jgi:predicted porin